MADTIPDRSLAGLLGELTRETATLLRQELRLARSEMADKARQARWGLAEIAVGALLVLVALMSAAAAAVLGLATAVPPWVAALIVAALLLLVGAVALARGLNNVGGGTLAPRRTLDSLRENSRWAKEQLR